MSTEIATIKGRAYHDESAWCESDLTVETTFGGFGLGKMARICINNRTHDKRAYTQLTKEQIKKLRKALKECLT